MKTIKWLLLVGGITAAGPAQAQDVEWDDSTRLALAQCFVGEAGWTARTEHAAMAHVLFRNYQRFARRNANATFEGRIRQYCAVHRVRTPTDRQQWVRALPWGPLEQDPGLPSVTDWRNWTRAWDYVRETVALFEAGDLEDPLPTAEHWGSLLDGVPRGGILLARTVNGEQGRVQLRNYFYRIDRRRRPRPGVIIVHHPA